MPSVSTSESRCERCCGEPPLQGRNRCGPESRLAAGYRDYVLAVKMDSQSQGLVGSGITRMQAEDHVHLFPGPKIPDAADQEFHIPIVETTLNPAAGLDDLGISIDTDYLTGNAALLRQPIVEDKRGRTAAAAVQITRGRRSANP